MKFTILGSGASAGVPAAGGYWGDCDPTEPKNERTRASLLVQSETTNILVDTTVDLRIHLNRVKVPFLDGILLTHEHSDHINGIDDLRVMCYDNDKPLDLYSNKETLDEIHRRWPYIFHRENEIYRDFCVKTQIENYDKFKIGDIDVESFEQDHFVCKSLGFRFGDFAYSADLMDLNEKSFKALAGIETWVVDACAYKKEKMATHVNLKYMLEWVERLKPKMTYITILNSQMDYKTLCNELPAHVRPAYDGLVIETN